MDWRTVPSAVSHIVIVRPPLLVKSSVPSLLNLAELTGADMVWLLINSLVDVS